MNNSPRFSAVTPLWYGMVWFAPLAARGARGARVKKALAAKTASADNPVIPRPRRSLVPRFSAFQVSFSPL